MDVKTPQVDSVQDTRGVFSTDSANYQRRRISTELDECTFFQHTTFMFTMDADDDEIAKRAAAAHKQLQRMFQEPPGQAYDGEDEGSGQVDEEELEEELEELEDELREEMDDW